MEFRREHSEVVHTTISEFCAKHTKEELYEEGQRRRISITPINTPREFIESPHTKSRQIFIEMEHPVIGKYMHYGPVPKFSETPGRVTRTAPLIGEHNEEIYCGQLGFSKEDVIALTAAGVI